jgi:hypothetical protein
MTIILLLGFTVGIILALTGAGGGILAVPLLVFGAGLSMAQAGPIGLLAVGLAAALGAVMGLKSGTVRYKAAMHPPAPRTFWRSWPVLTPIKRQLTPCSVSATASSLASASSRRRSTRRWRRADGAACWNWP